MLEFTYKETHCKINDDYSIECAGEDAQKIKNLWSNLLQISEPSKPCPIDEMCNIMKSSGANIVEYQEEFDDKLVY